MKTWLRLLITGIEAAIVLAAIYFEPTYCVRGKLWREAFFEDRPTSYWRERIDHWTSQFQTVGQAAAVLDWVTAKDLKNIDDGVGVVLVWDYQAAPTPSLWQRARTWASCKDHSNDWTPPEVLTSADPAAQEVLKELMREEPYASYAKKSATRSRLSTAGP